MAFSQSQLLKQSQSLVMTPQLQQAILLLKLNNEELGDYVERELEKNPLLERDERAHGPVAAEGDTGLFTTATPDQPGTANAVDSPAAEAALNRADSHNPPSTSQIDAESDPLAPADSMAGAVESMDETWQGAEDAADIDVGASVAFENWGGSSGGGGGSLDFQSDDFGFEDRLVSAETLREHIERQINIDIQDPQEKLIARVLTDNLDESGYLVTSVAEVALQLGCDPGDVEAVLQRLHRFEPTGIFSRNLKECLSIQLAEKRLLDAPMLQILDNLEYLAEGNLSKLAKICRTSIEGVVERLKLIRGVNPKPAQGYGFNVAAPVSPDVILRPAPSGGWSVELNPENLPRVLVNNSYAAAIKGGKIKESDRDYLNEQLNNANWLVRALHQRATTIMKVASSIVERQQGFFSKGVAFMRPLVLRDIAEAVDIHESTVSRATRDKFIQTPRGVFELKYFFSASISGNQGGADHSAEAVRHRIKSLVDSEDKTDVLSDDTLVEKLRAEGVDIARRTVAKYRESLKIPSSVKRRRIKAMS